MPTNFPTSLDVLTNPNSGDALTSPSHASQHANANDAIEAIEAYVWRPNTWSRVRYTVGDIAVTTTTVGATISVLQPTVNAVAGDVIEVGLSAREAGSPPALSMRLDAALMVGGSPVRYLSSEASTAASTGLSGWFWHASAPMTVSGSVIYTLVSGDISAGVVTVRLSAWLSGAGTRSISASTSGPLVLWVRNHKQ